VKAKLDEIHEKIEVGLGRASNGGEIDVTKVTVSSIPTFKSGNFNAWFDARTPEEISYLYQVDNRIRRKIESGLRADGGMHEYLKVSQAPKWKAWGVTAKQVQVDYAVPTEKLRWTVPKDVPDESIRGLTGGHRVVDSNGNITATGSGTFHIELDNLIERSDNLQKFDDGLKDLYIDGKLEYLNNSINKGI